MLFVLGLGLAVARWRDVRSRFLLLWFFVGILVTGVLSKYDYVSVSRLHYQLPVIAILAALAVDRGLAVAQRVFPLVEDLTIARNSLSGWALAGVVLTVLGVTYGNLHRWFVEAPAAVPSTPDALTIRVIENPVCQHAPRAPLVVAEGIGGALPPATAAIGVLKRPDYAIYGQPPSWVETANLRCIIFRSPRDGPAAALYQSLATRWPAATSVDERDRSGEVTVRVYYPPARG
jgi:hypothetical protein